MTDAPSPFAEQLAALEGNDQDSILLGFLAACESAGITLYDAQEQAVLELMDDKHVVLNTPTGSGKSLVAQALVFRALAEGKRVVLTFPIKALVSEKFFALCRDFGASSIGMQTGDAAINPEAPVICCTAEILANQALREAERTPFDYAVLDEFHYYGDRERGMAWAAPLLAMPKTLFLPMSATLGDMRPVVEGLQRRSGREVSVVTSTQRPVPLEFVYSEDPIHEALEKLLSSGKAPVYVVCFTQREAAEQAQNLTSIEVCSKDEKQIIAQDTKSFRFDTPYGKDMRRFIRHGVGLHHAGLLPKYRRLSEQLAQQGLLKVICGTDTLGVGINVPIRSVLFTQLCKFDGQKVGILSVRDFKQIAGRAGRKGFDDEGTVVCQAPAHVIENKRMESRVEANAQKKKRKLVKKKPPQKNYVAWNNDTFRHLQESPPETLESVFRVDHAVLLNCLQYNLRNGNQGYRNLIRLIAESQEKDRAKSRHRKDAAALLRSLRHAGVVNIVRNRQKGNRLVLADDAQGDLSLNHALSLFALEILDELDREAADYHLRVLSLTEAILESPRVILIRQKDKAKDELMAEMKAEGIEYEERLERLEEVEHPKPDADFLYPRFNAYAETHPWVGHDNIRPKSIAREMVETYASFAQYTKDYGLQRSEGILLRYLSDVYKALVQTVPESHRNEDLDDVLTFLRATLQRVDSSLVQEWEDLKTGATLGDEEIALPAPKNQTFDPRRDSKAFASRVRTEVHRWMSDVARCEWEEAAGLLVDETEGDLASRGRELERTLTPFMEANDRLRTDHEARLRDKTHLERLSTEHYQVTQTLLGDVEGEEWNAEFEVDVPRFADEEPFLRLRSLNEG